MTIHIEALTLDVIIGLLDFERDKTQKVVLNIEIDYPYLENDFIDYAHIVSLVHELLEKNKYELLEDALLELEEVITQNYAQIAQLKIKISKPNILANCIVSLSKTWNF